MNMKELKIKFPKGIQNGQVLGMEKQFSQI